MDIESDRMENLRIDGANLKSEREVVKEERRFRVDNNPQGILREALFSTLFKVHPYRWPVIGSMQDLDNVSVETAQNFHKTYYAPNNAVLVIAGDFKPDLAKKWIEKYYGGLKAQPLPQQVRPTEPVQTSPRAQILSREVQNTQFVLAYQAPSSGADDAYALDLLANILGNGTSSRMYQQLVYKNQLATSAYAYNSSLQESGVFQLVVNLKPGASVGEAERAVRGIMWRPSNLLVTEQELRKAKNQVMKSYVDGLKTIHGKAESLAMNEILFGDYERLFSDLDRYNRVTPEQIRKAAQKYLGKEKSTLVVLMAKRSEQKKSGEI
jgi:zinc protease